MKEKIARFLYYLLGVSLVFVLVGNAAYGQCPTAAKAIIDTIPASCLGSNDGSIRVRLTDSSLYKGRQIVYTLYKYNNTTRTFVTRTSSLSKYNYRFTGLQAGAYDIEVTTSPFTVAGCGTVRFEVLKSQGLSPKEITRPVAADAGGQPTVICDSNWTIMDAEDPNPGNVPPATGKWTVVSGPNTPTFFDDTDPKTMVNGLIQGDYKFQYTNTSPGCTTSGVVDVQARNKPQAKVGSDTTACSLTSFSLQAQAITIYNDGLWSQTLGPNSSTIASPTSSTTTASNLTAGKYIFKWVVSDRIGFCESDSAFITVNNNVTPATVTPSLSPNPVCEGQPVTFSINSIVATDTYTWSGPNGFTFTHTGAQALPSIAKVALSNAGNYTVAATLNGCTGPASTPINLVVNPKPAKTTITASTNPICQGQTLTLTAATASPVTWTLPNGTTSTANPLVVSNIQTTNAGKYKVSVSSGVCSSDPDSVTIAVTTLITPTITASGTGTYCSGSGFTLTAGPTTTGATYTWTKPDGSSFVGQVLSIASAATTDGGTYSLSINANGCTGTTTTRTITVNQTPTQPGIISGSTSVCKGDNNLPYSVTSTSGVTYLWSYAPSTGVTILGSTSAVQISYASTASSGVLSVQAVANACSSAVRTSNITVNSIPTTPAPTSNSPVCAGNTITLNTATVAGATYTWAGPNGFTSTLQNPTIANASAATHSGAYSVIVKVANCSSVAGTVNVVVNPVFSATASSNTPVCVGSTLNLTATTIPSATYAWTGPNSFTSSSQNPTIASAVAANAGTYSVVATVNGCAGPAATTVVAVNTPPSQPGAFTTSKTPVCQGEKSVTYTVPNVAGVAYVWSYTGTGATINGSTNTVTVDYAATATSGALEVRAIASACTSLVRSINITVNTVPSAPTLSSNSPVCAGKDLNLTAANVTGGTFAWTGPNSFVSAVQNPTITGVTASAAGVYTSTVTIGGCTSASASTTVAVTTVTAPTASNNGPICAGSSLALTATGGVGTYNWTGPNSFTSSTQNPTIAAASTSAAGNYTVTLTQGTCTSASASTTVVVNALPTQPGAFTTSKAIVCQGETGVAYTVPLTAGVTYIWSYTGTGATINGSSNSVTVDYSATATSGKLQVITVANACSSAVRSVDVVVNTIPVAPTAGSNSPVCAGSTLNLTASTIVGATYVWTGPNSFSSTSQNPSITAATAAAAGTYTVTATVGSCKSLAGTVTVAVNAVPSAPTSITGNIAVCQGESGVTYATSSTGSTGYAWSYSGTGATITGTGSTATIDYAANATSGTLSVRGVALGCSSAVAIQSITVNPIPAAPTLSSNTPVCAGKDLNLTAASVTGGTFAWTGPNSFSASVQNPTLTAVTSAAAGAYSATVTVAGCKSASASTNVFVTTVTAPTASNNGPICTGSNLILTATGGAGTYAWTGPNSFTSSSQNPTITAATSSAAGIYSVTLTQGACTSSVATTTAVVNTTPAQPANFTVVKNTVCQGETGIVYTVPLVAGVSYVWTYTGTGATINGTTNSVTVDYSATATAGNLQVTAVIGACSSSVRSTAIIVNTVPATPTAGSNSPVCIGSNVNLTATTIAGATYAWTGPNSFSSTSQNPSITAATAAAAGTYTVIATVGSCKSLAATTTVSLSPVPGTPSAIGGKTTVCQGESGVSYSSSSTSATSYAWSYSGTGATITGTGSSVTVTFSATATSGTLSVRGVTAACSSNVTTLPIVVNPIPAAPTLGSNTPVCVGKDLNLTSANVTGGTFAWTGPNGFTSTSQNPTIIGATTAATGSYNATVTVGGCQSIASTTAVVVQPLPIASASNTGPYCAGSTLQLNATAVAGATYAWTGPNSFVSAVQNPTISNVTAAAAGSYSLTVTQNGCVSLPATTVVSVNTTPAQPAAFTAFKTAVCPGETGVVYTVPFVSGVAYIWSYTGTGATINGSTNTVTVDYSAGATSGDVQVMAVAGACSSAVQSKSVIVNPIPVTPTPSSNSPVCSGSTINLTASTIAGATYAWTGPNGFTSALQNPTLTATAAAAGSYSVQATVGGCSSTSASTTVSITPIPGSPTSIVGKNTVCQGEATVAYSTSSVGATSYVWSYSGTGATIIGTGSAVTIAFSSTATSGNLTVSGVAAGCNSTVTTQPIVVNTIPSAPTLGSNTPVCVGKDINLTAASVAGGTFAWTGPNGFSSVLQNPTITSATLAANGPYVATVTVGGCQSASATTNVVIQSAPTASASNTGPYCAGATVQLNAATVAGANYAWSGPNGFTSTIQNPTIVNAAVADSGAYTLTVTQNGCTSNASITHVAINTTPSQPAAFTTFKTPVCQGESGVVYTVPSVVGLSYVWTYSGTGATINGTSNSVTVDYASTATSGNLQVRAVAGVCSSAVQSRLVTVNQIPATPTASSNTPICEGGTITLNASTVAGATYAWTGPNGFTATSQNPSITNAFASASGTYSVIATLNGCASIAGTTNVTINAIPSQPTLITGKTTVCQGETGVAYSTSSAGATSYIWTYSATGATLNGTGSTVTVDFASTALSGTLSVRAVIGACTSLVRTQTITVSPVPKTPTLKSSNSPVCVGSTLHLQVDPVAGATINWSLPDGTTFTGTNYVKNSVTVSDQGNYLVTATSGGCTSSVLTIPVQVNPGFTLLANSNSPVCVGTDLNFTATGTAPPSATYAWTFPDGNTISNQNFTITNAQVQDSGTYSVVAKVGACTSSPVTTHVIVSPVPTTPVTVTGGTTICQGTSQTFSVPSFPGESYIWTYKGTGATFPSGNIGNPITINFAANATGGALEVVAFVKSCSSGVKSTTLLISTLPTTPVAKSNVGVCQNDSIHLSATTIANATYAWTGPNGFTSSQQNPVLAGATTAQAGNYVVTYSLNGCQGDRDTVVVTVNPIPTADFAYPSTTYCLSEANAAPLSVPTGSVFSVSTTGLVVNTSTGVINIAGSTAGSYTILNTVTNSFSCTDTATFKVTLLKAPVARSFSYAAPLCDGVSGNVLPTFTSSGDVGTFKVSSGGLTLNTNTGAITSSTSVQGIYKVTYTSIAGTCADSTSSNVTILASPAKPVLSGPTSICTGKTATYAATSGSATDFNWFKGGSLVQSTGTTFTTNTAGNHFVTTVGANGCMSPSSDTIALIIAPKPAVPVIQGGCTVSAPPVTLSTQYTSLAGFTYAWFRSSTVLGTASTQVAATAGTYKTIVTQTSTGCSSDTSAGIDPFGSGVKISIVSGTNPFCSGDSMQVASNSPTGNTWTLAGTTISNSATTFVKTAGKLVLTVTNGTCSGKDSITINVTPSPAKPAIVSASDSLCPGDQLTLSTTATGGVQWLLASTPLSGATNPTLNVNIGGAYQVRATSGSCSSTSDVKNIGVRKAPVQPQMNLSGPQQICQGGALALNITNFISTQDQWVISNVPVSGAVGKASALTANTAGRYKVIRVTSGGCIATSDSVDLTVNPNQTPSVSVTPSLTGAICAKSTIIYTASETNAGTSPVFQWYVNSKLVQSSSTKTLQLDTLTKSSVIRVTVVSSNACALPKEISDSVPVSIAPRFKVQTVVKPIGCSPSDGSITFTITNNAGTVSFTGDLTSANNVVTVAKTYQVKITDNGSQCTLDTSIAVTKLTPFTLTAALTQPKCFTPTGAITISLNPSFGTYKVLGGSLAALASTDLKSGTHTISIQDQTSLCTIDTSFVLQPADTFTTNITVKQPDCGKNNGTITITPTPTGAYSYFDDLHQAVNNNLAPGVYKVTTSNGKCDVKDTVTLSGKTLFALHATVVSPLCGQKGSIKLSTIPKVDFEVTGALNDSVNNAVSAGTYAIRVTDKATGCFKDTSIVLNENKGFIVAVDTTRPKCFEANGAIALDIQPAGSYQITGDLTQATTTGLLPKTYQVSILSLTTTCKLDTSIVLTPVGRFTTAITATQPECGKTNGAILITPSPTGSYTYSQDLTAANTINLGPKIYYVSTTNGSCVVKDTIALTGTPSFTVQTTVVQPQCLKKGSIAISTTPAISFKVTGGLTNAVTTNLSEGTYNFQVTDNATGCFRDTAIVLNDKIDFSLEADTIHPTCFEIDGAINLIMTRPLKSHLTFTGDLIEGNNGDLGPNTYSVSIVNDSSGCKLDTSFTLVSKGKFAISKVTKDPDCGVNNGSIAISTTPASGSYTYTGDITKPFTSGLASGIYKYKVTNALNCEIKDTITIKGKAQFALSAKVTQPTCSRKGSIVLTTTGNTFTVSGGLTAASNTGLAPGIYTFTVTDDVTGCTKDSTITLDVFQRDFILTADTSSPKCFNKDGFVNLKTTPASSGTVQYIVIGSQLILGNNTSLDSGTYQISVIRRSSGCRLDTSFTLKSKGRFTSTPTVTQPDCGIPNGIVSIANAPVGPTYSIAGDLTQALTSGLAPKTYRYTVTDGNSGCSKKDSAIVSGKTQFVVSADIIDPFCTAKGSIRLHTTPKVDFSVSVDLNDSVNTNLDPGGYKVRITDKATGCFKDTSFTLNKKVDFTLRGDTVQPSCLQKNGSINLQLTAGNTYTITSKLVEGMNANLASGNYPITVINQASGCRLDTGFVLKNKGGFTVNTLVQQPTCGANDGAITILTNPIGKYVYTGDMTADTATKLAPKTYIFTVTDTTALKCAVKDTIDLSGKPDFKIEAQVVQPLCDAKGSIKISTVPVISFTLSGDLTSPETTDLDGGSYAVRVTDNTTKCFIDSTFLLHKKVDFKVLVDVEHPQCRDTNGTISLILMPPPPIGRYMILGVDSTTLFSNSLDAGNYPITVQNLNTGCLFDTTVTLNRQGFFSVNTLVTQPDCITPNGSVLISLDTANMAPGTYTFASTKDLTKAFSENLSPGTYTYQITNTACTITDSVKLNGKPKFAIASKVVQPGCVGDIGSIELGTVPSIDFRVEGDLTSKVNTDIGVGTYDLTIVDNTSGCSKDTTITLVKKTTFILASVEKQPSCNKADGSIILRMSPSSATNYVVTGDLTADSSLALTARDYTIRVKDTVSGCVKDTVITLKNQPDFKLLPIITRPICSQPNGVIILNPQPAPVSDYTFSGQLTADTTRNLAGGSYNVVVTRKGTTCALDTTIQLRNLTNFHVDATITKPLCGKSDGIIALKVSPAPNSDYNFGGDFTNDTLRNVKAGTYKLELAKKSDLSCVKDTSFTIEGKPDFTVTASTTPPTCNKEDGVIRLRISEPTANFDLTGDLTADTTRNLGTGSYKVKVTRKGTACAFDTNFTFATDGPQVDLGLNDTLCGIKNKKLKANTIGSGNYTYVWYQDGDSLTTTTVDTIPDVTPIVSTTYEVRVSDSKGCPGIDSIRLVKPAEVKLLNTSHYDQSDKYVDINFLVTNPQELKQDSVYILRRAVNTPFNTKWDTVASVLKTKQSYLYELARSNEGSFNFMIGLPGKNYCGTALQTKIQRNVQVTVKGDEELETTYLKWNSFVNWDSAVYEYQVWRSLEGGPLEFYVSGNLDTLANYINASDGRKQCYQIRAIEKGPKDSAKVSRSNIVCVNFENILKPYNIFTPNGDGHNDVFFFKNIHFYPGNVLHVFNRWGNKVFSQTDYNNTWDGDGLPAGTYFYILDLKDGSAPLQGDVLLHR